MPPACRRRQTLLFAWHGSRASCTNVPLTRCSYGAHAQALAPFRSTNTHTHAHTHTPHPLSMADQLDCALDLMRRLPPADVEDNLAGLIDLVGYYQKNTLCLVFHLSSNTTTTRLPTSPKTCCLLSTSRSRLRTTRRRTATTCCATTTATPTRTARRGRPSTTRRSATARSPRRRCASSKCR